MDKRQPAGDGLRTSAELRLGRRTASNVAAPDLPEDELVHELQVHQIELEMQNAELRQAQHPIEESRDRYLDLYGLTPVGYLTLDSVDVIVEANLNGAEMFGLARNSLLNRRFASLISPSGRNHWHGLFILESSVERVRVWGCRVVWQGATTRVAAPRKEEQRCQTTRQTHNRMRSGVTQLVSSIEGNNAGVHETSRRLRSGQQRIQGS